MASRHLSRSIALQTLFEWDTGNKDIAQVSEVLDRNVEEFAPGSSDIPFMKRLVLGVIEKREDIDTIITKAAPEWPLERISPIDRNILRIGLFELIFTDHGEVPPKVALNEAIELAKAFGGESSSRFVNGVLGAVYKELGEPGKDQTTKKKSPEDYPLERLAGAVVFARDGAEIYVALVHDIFGHWTLSKGHLEEAEDAPQGIVRIVLGEIGITGRPLEELGGNEYVANNPEKGKIRKQVVYYLVEGPFDDLTLKKTGGLDDARWFKLQDIIDLNFYNDMLPVITKAVNILLAKPNNGSPT